MFYELFYIGNSKGDRKGKFVLNLHRLVTVSEISISSSATDVKVPATPEKKIPVVEPKPVHAASVESVQEAIQHGVHVQEMRMKEYLLPILLGAGVGFILLVLVVSLLVCFCCKRKLKQKMKMVKEMEIPNKEGRSTPSFSLSWQGP